MITIVIFLGGAIAPSLTPLPAAVSEIIFNFSDFLDASDQLSQAKNLARYPEPIPVPRYPKETPWLPEQRRFAKSERDRFYHGKQKASRYPGVFQGRQFLRSKKPAT